MRKLKAAKKTPALRFRLPEAQYRIFIKEARKHDGDPTALLRFLMRHYFGKDGDGKGA